MHTWDTCACGDQRTFGDYVSSVVWELGGEGTQAVRPGGRQSHYQPENSLFSSFDFYLCVWWGLVCACVCRHSQRPGDPLERELQVFVSRHECWELRCIAELSLYQIG